MTLSAAQRATLALLRFGRGAAPPAGARVPHPALEHCELCAAPVASAHEHVLEAKSRALRCVCAACALLFDDDAASGPRRYRRLRAHASSLADTALTDADLAALGVPVRLVFLCPSRVHDALFMIYPSAAGPIEAASTWRAWQELVARYAALSGVEPDRDAIVVDLRAGTGRAALQLSLDLAYELLGLLRSAQAASRFASFEARLDALHLGGGQRA